MNKGDATALATGLIEDYEAEKSNRSTWEAHWEQIAERVMPRMSGHFTSAGVTLNQGARLTSKMIDPTAALAAPKFAAVMTSLNTPANRVWHKIKDADDDKMKIHRVAAWYERANKAVMKHRYRPEAAFETNNTNVFLSEGVFGTGAMFSDRTRLGQRPGLRYMSLDLQHIFVRTSSSGIVDCVFRRIMYTSRQAIQEWGLEALSEPLRKKIDKQKASAKNELIEFVQIVMPREEAQDFGRIATNKEMPVASIYLEVANKHLVRESGYRTFPFMVPRYLTGPEEKYGRSPAMLALPAIKTLNAQKKTVLKQGQRSTDPVILAHDDGVMDSLSLQPGHINYGAMSKDGKPLVGTLPVGRVDIGRDMMNDERETINEAFLITLFQILVETPTMTATEVIERTREKGMLLAPTAARQQLEYLHPLVGRDFDLLAQQGLLDAPPPELADSDFEIDWDSPMAQAQRAEEAAGAMRSYEFWLNIATTTGDMSVLDHFDTDVMAPEMMEISGMPIRWRRAEDKIQAIRDQRAKDQAKQQAIEAAPAMAGLAKAGN